MIMEVNMKKIISITLIFILIFCMPLFANAEFVPNIDKYVVNEIINEDNSVDVICRITSKTGIGGANFALEYEGEGQDFLKYIDIKEYNSSSYSVVVNDDEESTLKINVVYEKYDTPSNEVLLKVSFKSVAFINLGALNMRISCDEVLNADGEQLEHPNAHCRILAVGVNGKYDTDIPQETDTAVETDTVIETDTSTEPDIKTDTVTETDTQTDTNSQTDTVTETDTQTDTTSQTDTVTETDTQTDTTSQTDTVTDTDTQTDTETETDTPDPEKYMYGDVNMDGKISASDALLVQRCAISLVKFNDDVQMILADVNDDGRVTAADCMAILRYSISLHTNTRTGQWYICV